MSFVLRISAATQKDLSLNRRIVMENSVDFVTLYPHNFPNNYQHHILATEK